MANRFLCIRKVYIYKVEEKKNKGMIEKKRLIQKKNIIYISVKGILSILIIGKPIYICTDSHSTGFLFSHHQSLTLLYISI